MIYENINDKIVVNMLTYVPEINGELKTKPSQSGFKSIMAHGIIPDFIFCRSPIVMDQSIKNKIGMFTNTKSDYVINLPNVEHTYLVFKLLEEANLIKLLLNKLDLDYREKINNGFDKLISNLELCKEEIKIGIIGKYTSNADS